MAFATPEQVALLADVIQPEYRALVLTAAYSSLRWGELAGLRRHNVNPLHRTVTVVEQLTEVNGAPRVRAAENELQPAHRAAP